MRGASVAGALAAARDGDEQAFVQLWTDVNPALVRYLAVIGAGSADELAIRIWAELVGKLRRFRGDEAAWRRLVFITARACARQQDGAVGAKDPYAAPRLLEADDTLDSVLTRVALDLVAVLPEPQPEVIVLRSAGRLGVRDVAKVLKLSEPTVRAAAHAGLARAGALAAEDSVRGLIDRGEPVEDPSGWERTGFVAGLGTVQTAFEDLLAGRSVGPGAPGRTRLIGAVLTALRAPAAPSELRGLVAARAAYERQFAGVPRHAVGFLSLGSRAAVGAAAAMIGLSGTAFAAYAGMLPAPLQDAAHNWFNAPAHSPESTTPNSPQPSAALTGSTSAPGPGATSSPAPGTTKATPDATRTSPGTPTQAPLGATKTPPGTPTHAPPGSNTPPGSTKTPPGSNTPPGSTKTPPGSTKTPPGSTNTPPGSTKTAGTSNVPPGSTNTPPGSTKTPPGSTKTPPGSTKSPHGGGVDQSR